jgi:hypothetical protein
MLATLGDEKDSKVSRVVINLRIRGLAKPIRSEAEACTPGVFVNRSMVNPKVTAKISIRALGMSNGSKTINKI